MSIEERDTMRAIQSLNKKTKDQCVVDWEQRRYEIAKTCLPAILAYYYHLSQQGINAANRRLPLPIR